MWVAEPAVWYPQPESGKDAISPSGSQRTRRCRWIGGLGMRLRLYCRIVANVDERKLLEGKWASNGRYAERKNEKPTDARALMYHHIKKLMYTVNIGEPDVRF